MKKLSAAMILAAGTLWGTMGIFVRIFSELGFSSIQTAALRIVSAALILTIITFVIGGKKAFVIRLRDIGWFIGSGFLSIAGMSVLYFSSIKNSSMCVAAILLYTAPVIVMIFSVFLFKEKFTVKKLVALVCAFAGCVFVTGLGGHVTPLGVVLGIGSGFAYASYSLFGTVLLRRYSPLTVTTYSFIIAAIGLLCVCDLPEVVRLYISSGSALNISILAVVMGLVTAASPFILYTLGLKGTEAGMASVMASVEPLVATLLGFIVFNEKIGVTALLGIVLIIFAVLLLNNVGRQNNEKL